MVRCILVRAAALLITVFCLESASCFAPGRIQIAPCRPRHDLTLGHRQDTSLHVKKDWTTSIFPVLPVDLFSPEKVPANTTLLTVNQVLPPSDRSFFSQAYVQALATIIGVLSGVFVAGFKLSIESIREYCDGVIPYDFVLLAPVLGGAAVGVLSLIGGGGFPPGVRGVVGAVDKDSLGTNEVSQFAELIDSFRKASAAIFTLGTGCSLGPEGPGVEIGIAASRLAALVWPPRLDTVTGNEVVDAAARVRRNRLFLACGAAAGVSSGFNAPLSGVFFALEVIQKNLGSVVIDTPSSTETEKSFELVQESLSSETGSITAILTSSVLGALISRELLGNELALQRLSYEIPTPLPELPLYLALGFASGTTAVIFSQVAKGTKEFFDGDVGPEALRNVMGDLPSVLKPMMGGLTCSVTAFYFPQVLFFGYETLNALLDNGDLSTTLALQLLGAKIFATAVSASSGLVGGLLAPSLFMGGMVGASFHNVVEGAITSLPIDAAGSSFVLADISAWTMVGAASFLAAVFRAPLTASLLAFETTRDYGILLPLIASAGFATLICDLVEGRLEALKRQ